MPGGKYEPVAVGPVGRGGIVLEVFGPQHRGHVGHAHRHAGMPRIRRLHRIHRQRADGIGHGRKAVGI